MHFKEREGFTLIELMLYVGISALMIFVMSIFLSTMLRSKAKSETIAEVEGQGSRVMALILQSIRNAEAVSAPAPQGSSSSINLDVVDVSNDPTIIDLDSGYIRITEGAGSPINLTNSRIDASGLNFSNLSRPGTRGLVQVEFTLSHINPEGRYEYDYSKTFTSSASLR